MTRWRVRNSALSASHPVPALSWSQYTFPVRVACGPAPAEASTPPWIEGWAAAEEDRTATKKADVWRSHPDTGLV
ncbi:MAG: hypothetical protein ABI969_01480 [bacterium]